MEPIKLECTYEERKSKQGNTYKCLVIKESENYSKIVLVDAPEQALIESSHKKTDSPELPF